MSILLTGGTGFVGKKLIDRLEGVSITSRNGQRAREKFADKVNSVIEWKPATQDLTLPSGRPYDQVINLMGESIAEGRWSDAKKKRIRDSRVQGTRKLVDALLKSDEPPSTFVSASAIGIYGDAGEATVDEQHEHGTGFLTDVCQEWEAEAFRLADHGVRVVCLRIGIVLGQSGGALEKMLPLFKWGLGGKLGSGKQWMAWIHVDDLVSMIVWALNANSVSGPVNATAPNPVRNKEFTAALAKTVNRPAWLPAPKFGLRLALGEFANSLFFSQKVVPNAALENGFVFQFPNLEKALVDIVQSK
jgi:uncharacterized protein (TIGR01777 family)